MTSQDVTPTDLEGKWQRPVPVIGDTSTARQRADDPAGWAFPQDAVAHLASIIAGRRDIRRFRPDPVPDDLLSAVLESGHLGPSVGFSQPWRFIVVRDPRTRDRAAALADALRIEQAAALTPERGQQLLDLKLEGLREAPVGIVVACDRRTPALGVLGRATFTDADMWSCACAVQNMWLTARAHGLGMGWVTLFRPDDLADLLDLPDGVDTLGWLCVGWPDERPPEPGLQRLAWGARRPLDDIVMHERWPGPAADRSPSSPTNHLRSPDQQHTVAATDDADQLLSPPGSLGVLDRVLDRIVSCGAGDARTGTLVLVGADHPVTTHGVSAYAPTVTREVMHAAVAGTAMGVVSARGAGLDHLVIDAGTAPSPVEGAVTLPRMNGSASAGDLVTHDAMPRHHVDLLVDEGRHLGRTVGNTGMVVLGEVGVGNTTVAAALAAALLPITPHDAVGLGAGADCDIVDRKIWVVTEAVQRMRAAGRLTHPDPLDVLAGVGGPEFAVLTGVILGAAEVGAPIVLDGLATGVPALIARRLEPAVHAYLIAGQRSRERAHSLVLQDLGLEPLLELRLRAGEGVGASLACSLVLQGLQIRRDTARTH